MSAPIPRPYNITLATSVITFQRSPIISKTQAPADAPAMTINVIPSDDGCTYKKFKRDNCFLIHQTTMITQLNNIVSISIHACIHTYLSCRIRGGVCICLRSCCWCLQWPGDHSRKCERGSNCISGASWEWG